MGSRIARFQIGRHAQRLSGGTLGVLDGRGNHVCKFKLGGTLRVFDGRGNYVFKN